MKKIIYILWMIIFVSCILNKVSGQVTEEWVQVYNGPDNKDDLSRKVVVDSFGNVYVTGTSTGIGTSDDYATIKYNSNGVQQWVQRYNGPGNSWDNASSIALDVFGNVYVTGNSMGIESDEFATIKYNSNGVQQWVQRYKGPGNSYFVVPSMVVDSFGNVYVTGTSTGIGTRYDFATIKYNSAGVQQWVQRYNGPGNLDDGATSIALDGSGNVYVTGTSTGIGTSSDFATIKYNSAGVQQWVQRYNGPGNSYDNAASIALDGFGNVYVTGNSGGNASSDFATIKYNSNGVQQWVQRFNPEYYFGGASSMVVDNYGNVYVTGDIGRVDTDLDYVTIKYNSNGVQQWVQRYNGPENQDEVAFSIAMDVSNNIYVTGISVGAIDYFVTVKYNPLGVVQWIQRTSYVFNGFAGLIPNFVDVSGNVYVAGSSMNVTTWHDYKILKYSQSQQILINTPAVGENLIAGSTKYIQWNANSSISNVKIEFSFNNGSNWSPVTLSVPAAYNSYLWTVPNVNSTQCKIRISNTANSSVNAESGVFTITQNSTEIIKLKIRDATSSVKKVRFQYSLGVLYNTVPVTNGQCLVKNSDLPHFPQWGKINKIQLLDINNNLVGYINFEYKWSELSNKKVDAVLYVDEKTASAVEYNENPGWKYFSNQNEHLVYMLIPPNEKFESVRYSKPPLLFVHGIYGAYPTWGNQPKEIYPTYDGWQLYYPYDMRIRDCSYILKKAADKILSGEPTGVPLYETQLINIVAHSMGGLVSRYYIQGNIDQKVNKLLMLGTPNNGSLASYRSKTNESGIGTMGDIFMNKDRKSPAHIDMTPASDLLLYLKTSPMKPLNLRDRNKSYLVLAGSKTISALILLHRESLKQDDGVVSVSSASMLDSLIPLATKSLDHLELPENVPPIILTSFLNENYDPTSNPSENPWLYNIVSNVNGFYTTREDIKKNDESGMELTKGIIYFTIPGLNSEMKFEFNYGNLNSYFIDIKNPDYYSYYLNQNPEVPVSYFVRNNYSDITGALGLSLINYQGSIKLKFRKQYFTLFGYRYQSIPISTNTFTYKSLQTNWITLNLTDYEKHQINSNSFLHGILSLSNNSSQSSFFIDNSIDTISFSLYGIPNDTAFSNHNFKLTDPNNIIIDSVYASQHSNVIYKQSIEDAMAYYYIVDPESGNWSAQFNENITDPLLIAPIQSPVNPDLQFIDSVYSAGDSIKFFSTLPTESGISNLQYTANVSFIRRGTNTVLDIGNAIMKQVGHYKFEGQFFARGIGEYRVKLDLNCTYNNQNIHRENYNAISVASLRIPSALFPKNDSISVPETATFVWNRNYNSDYYELQIFRAGDTIPAFTNTGITDTSIMISSFERETSYLWRIRAFNNTDTSNWSEPKIFTTIVNPPDNVVLNNPPNNSGGLYTPLSFQWSRSANAEKYNFQISTDSLFGSLEYIDSTITDTMIMINNLNYPQNYFWRVRALNAGGFSDFSDTWTLSTIEPSSQSFVYINVIPQGLYNNLTGSLQRSDTLKAYLVNTSSPFVEVDSSIAVLDSTLLQASFIFNNAESGIYYIKIKHRNSIETWSKEGGEAYNRFGKTYYDFTSAATQAFGNNMIQSGEKWCIYSGDVNQDGLIDLSDIVLIYNDATIFTSGNFVTDLNGDNFTDLTDLLIAFNNSTKFVTKISP